MTRRILIIVMTAVLMLAMLAAGCASSTDQNAQPSGGGTTPQGGGSTAPKTVELGEKDAGTTAAVAQGGTVIVALPGNPTTGYDWAVSGTLPSCLQQQGKSTFKSGGSAGMAGAPGVVTMKFSAVQRGSGELKLKYWRSFEPTVAPVKTWSAKIEVK